MIEFLILFLSLIFLLAIKGHFYCNKNVNTNDINILKKIFSNLNLKFDNSIEYKIVIINYDSIDLKKLDDFLCNTEIKYYIFLNSPTWIFNTRKEKWVKHYVAHTNEVDILFDDKYEYIYYDSVKGRLTKYPNVLETLQCIEALDGKIPLRKGRNHGYKLSNYNS